MDYIYWFPFKSSANNKMRRIYCLVRRVTPKSVAKHEAWGFRVEKFKQQDNRDQDSN